MILERREFLKLMGVAAGTVGVAGCSRRWAVPDHLVELALRGPGLESEMQSVCGLCEGGCGVTVRMVDGLPVGLRGNPNHPLNRGGLCPVGQAGLDILYAPNRLGQPLRRADSGELEPTTWDSALGDIVARLESLRADGQGRRLAVLLGEHDSLLADLAVQFTAALGSPNVAHFHAPEVTPYYLSQGIDEVPGVDLEGCDLALVFGLDLFEDGSAPLHAISALIGSRAGTERAALLHVGTRLSPTASKAEEHVTIRPGTYSAFALGLAHVLVREGRYDTHFVAERTFGFDDWTDDEGRSRVGFRRLLIERYYPDRVAAICGVDAATIVRVARRFASAAAPLALIGGEASQTSNATWSTLAVQALNALVAAFGRSSGGVLLPSPTPLKPLPVALGPDPEPATSLFASSAHAALLGVDPVEALTEGVVSEEHPVDVLIIVGGDPVSESPGGERLREALERIPMVVSLTSFADESSRLASIVLPTPVPLEDWRAVQSPSGVAFSVLGISQPVIEPLFDTRGPGDILLELARGAAGQEAAALLPWKTYEEYLRDRVEGLVVSGEGAIITGSFEEGWKHFLEERGWRFQETRRVEDFWQDLLRQAGWWNPVQSARDWVRLFRTPTGRFEFYSNRLDEILSSVGRNGDPSLDEDAALMEGARKLGLTVDRDELCLPHHEPPVELGEGELSLVPFRPITARGSLGTESRMVMEMFGYSVLSGWQTWVELTPASAAELGVEDGDLVTLTSDRSGLEAVVSVRPGVGTATAHVPLGLGHMDESLDGRRIGSNPLEIVSSGRDPLSGAPALAGTRVRLDVVRRREHGGPAPWHGGEGHEGEGA